MSTTSARQLPAHLTQRKAVLVLLDIVQAGGIGRAIGTETDWAIFIDTFYGLCSRCIRERGGEVIKYQGDACLAMFDDNALLDAIDAIDAIRQGFGPLCTSLDIKPTDVRAAVHVGDDVIVGSFGPEAQKDVTGRTVGILFSMEGRGIRMSEQAYRKLPSDKRGPWQKQGGHVVYVMK